MEKSIRKSGGLVCLLLVALAVSLFYGCGDQSGEKVKELISSGQSYLLEANYEKANAAFQEAIKLNDKSVEAYLGSADAYAGLKDCGMALDILVKGFESTKDEVFHKKVDEINELQRVESLGTPAEANSEYALSFSGKYYEISKDPVLETILEGSRMEEETFEEPPYSFGRRHYGNGFEIDTFYVNSEKGPGEIIYRIVAEKDAETPRGVGIGDSLADLQAAYPDLIYENGSYSYDSMPKYNRCYVYAPDDKTNYYIQFYLYEKIITKIEAGDSMDYRPGTWQPYSDIFGKTNIYKEINKVTSTGMETKYFYINDAGVEETLLDIHSRSVEEKDIDSDGITELVVYLTGNVQALGIYDFIDGAISYLDINETLQCSYSEFAGNMGNIRREYENCIKATFKNEDGTERSEVYRLKDNQLTYVCPFSEIPMN